jgi:predicted metal-binding membrane protein
VHRFLRGQWTKAEARGFAHPLSVRDRIAVLVGLAGVAGSAWIYLLFDAARMHGMAMGDPVAATAMKPWTALDLSLLFLTWAVMMVAMMLPSVAAAVLTFAAISQRIAPRRPAARSVVSFVVGYLAVWTGFSLVATGLQWVLDRLVLLSPTMVASSPVLGGALLTIAGLYQLSPLKSACLEHCQNPLAYLAQHWRHGVVGALRMGLQHGLYCVGCCWAIMGLLFVGGVMNLLWVAALSMFVLLEKLALAGGGAGRWFSGLAAVAAGIAMMAMAT